MEIALRWVVTWPDDPHTHDTMGSCKDGPWTIGTVHLHKGAWGRIEWQWDMTCQQVIHGAVHGDAESREAAQAKVEELYRAAVARDPASRDRLFVANAEVKRAQDMWAAVTGRANKLPVRE